MTQCEQNVVIPDRPQMTIRRMRLSGRIPKAIDTHSEYIFIVFPLEQWLRERPSMLSYTYVALLVFRKKINNADKIILQRVKSNTKSVTRKFIYVFYLATRNKIDLCKF
jgi:hypothetical protein